VRWNTFLMLGLALVFGALAIFTAQRWASRQALQHRPATAEAPAPLPTSTIVVASVPLRYGAELTARHLREIPWPADALPAGASRTVQQFLAEGRRVVLAPMEANEPVLSPKVTGPGQRGTLSVLLDEGMGAVTVHVNEVVGVAGFVLPGDRVDLLMTRHFNGGDGGQQAQASFTDVVLRNVRVLAVGQQADERTDKPTIVNAVTLEVDPVAAQKVALAAAAGTLSLMLRKAGETAELPGRRVSINEIGSTTGGSSTATVRVMRAAERKDYTVPSDGGVTATGNVRPSPRAPATAVGAGPTPARRPQASAAAE
jgi:pilus assembly protein CpaB